jgi:hypothetical protein
MLVDKGGWHAYTPVYTGFLRSTYNDKHLYMEEFIGKGGELFEPTACP